MSQIAAHAKGGNDDGHGGGARPVVHVDPAAVTLAAGSWQALSVGLLFVGVVSLAATLLGGYTVGPVHALAAYHMGFLVTVGFALGSLGLLMIFQQTQSGWSTTIHRQLANVAGLFPLCALLFVPVVALELYSGGGLFKWLSPSHAHGDPLSAHKAPYLNASFWLIRTAVYFGLWTFFGSTLLRLGRTQDTTRDPALTVRARRLSSFGLLIYALSTAFAAFDWMMSLDHLWFSTMYGVYFFVGNILSAIALCVVILSVLRLRGKLKGVVTDEHFHDLGKLLLSFSVFWAYIAFSQYFLIWYGNLPEETGWFTLRKENGWQYVGIILAMGQFGVPFLYLLWRQTKRNTRSMLAISVWIILVHVIDIFYNVRPSVYGPKGMGLENAWLDVLGILGPVCIFLGVLVRRIGAGPLIPLGDPRLREGLAHRNYV